jgi:universal stress protein A
MFHHIVVPVDLSDRTRASIQTALELGRRSAARITLLHVIETLRDVKFEEIAEFYDILRRRAEDRLDEWRKELGAELDAQIVYGRRAAEILRFAEEQRADLLVLSSHALSPDLPGGGLGTLSHQIALLAPCNVLLLR